MFIDSFYWLAAAMIVARSRSGTMRVRRSSHVRRCGAGTLHTSFFSAAALLVLLLGSPKAFAHDIAFGDLSIGHPWSRATPKGAEVGGAYFTVTNMGGEPDTLLSATSEASDRIEFHQMLMSGDVMKMGPVSRALEIAPGQTIAFEPGGLHLMLFGLKAPLTAGGSLEVELRFAKAGSAKAAFKIERLGAKSSSDEQGK